MPPSQASRAAARPTSTSASPSKIGSISLPPVAPPPRCGGRCPVIGTSPMKIYTKSGDGGETGLFGGARVRKRDARVDAYGEVDELIAALGAGPRRRSTDPRAGAGAGADPGRALHRRRRAGHARTSARARSALPAVDPAWAGRLEPAIDRWDAELPELRRFVVPGGTPAAAALHLARRRLPARRAGGGGAGRAASEVDAAVLVYLNRLSDLLFVAARLANHRAGHAETLWEPGAGR